MLGVSGVQYNIATQEIKLVMSETAKVQDLRDWGDCDMLGTR